MGIWILTTVLIITIAVLAGAYICFRIVFYVSDKKKKKNAENIYPKGEIYKKHYDSINKWVAQMREYPHEEVMITSFDGLKLYGKYYECDKNAPVELMFHGYRGTAERDLCGGIQRCFKLGRNALLVDQRASSKSEGNVITFGVHEHRDCLAWVNFAVDKFGEDVKIILTGISMGASTVLMAAGRTLPKNVIGVLADCGFSSAKEIIIKCAGDMKLPGKFIYPFVKLGAKLYGHFDIDEYSAMQAMETCKIPIIWYHGDADDFVPCTMSKRLYEKCTSKKKLVLISGAGHGVAYLTEPESYLTNLEEFFGEQ